MRKKIKYTDEPMEFRVVDDFLPPPEQLAQKENNVRVTITLSKASVGFFKRHAKRTHGHYQAMIRQILDHYVARYPQS
jgi:predicted DNA binding CopG/RHH family protein